MSKFNYAKFFSKRFKVVNKEAEIVPFNVNPIQKKYLEMMGDRDIILKARQQGFSTEVGGIFTADFLLRENILCMVIADDSDNAKGLLEKVKFFIESYEEATGAKVPLKYNSKYELHNEAKNSKYIIGTAQSGAVGRSKTIHNLHLSEAAFYRNMSDILTGALQAVPESGRVIIETTANGFNEFKSFWDAAELGENGFNPLFFPASDFYEPGFLEQKRKELSMGNKERLFKQEYPETPQEAFITSGETYFNKEALEHYLQNTREPLHV